MIDFSIYILAGGKSTRFGSDKARADVHGKPMILHIADTLGGLGAAIKVVAAKVDQYADLGLPTIADQVEQTGPIGGIHAALHDASTPWVLIVSCDFVGVKREWVRMLLSARREDVEAVAFRHECWEPLLALYRTNLGARVSGEIAAGRHSPRKLLDQIAASAISIPDDWTAVSQVNSPAELRAFTERA